MSQDCRTGSDLNCADDPAQPTHKDAHAALKHLLDDARRLGRFIKISTSVSGGYQRNLCHGSEPCCDVAGAFGCAFQSQTVTDAHLHFKGFGDSSLHLDQQAAQHTSTLTEVEAVSGAKASQLDPALLISHSGEQTRFDIHS